MKYLLILLTLCGSIIIGYSCSSDEVVDSTLTVPLSDYQKLEYRYNQLFYQFEAQQITCNGTINQVQKENVSLINQALQYRQKYEELVNSRSDAEGQLSQATGKVAVLKQELMTAESYLVKINSQYEIAVARTAACSPRDFASLDELKEWRNKQKDFGENTVANARKMQKIAWESGYILSVRPGVPDCIAFVGDSIYRITPAYDVEAETEAKEAEEEYISVWKVS